MGLLRQATLHSGQQDGGLTLGVPSLAWLGALRRGEKLYVMTAGKVRMSPAHQAEVSFSWMTVTC